MLELRWQCQQAAQIEKVFTPDWVYHTAVSDCYEVSQRRAFVSNSRGAAFSRWMGPIDCKDISA
jgi:hypothetical protein